MAKSTFLDFSTTAGDNTDCGGIGILGTNSVSNFDNAFRTLMAIIRRDLDNGTVFVTKSGDYTAVANDNNAFYEFTATATLTLTAAATLGADWHMMVFANGGSVTIDADGTELINGEETLVVADGDAAYLICTGTAFKAITIPAASSVQRNSGELYRGYISGLTLANNASDATNDIDVAVGSAGSDGTIPVLMTLSSALTKRLDAAWAVGSGNGGLDTGSIANTTYHVWLIQRSDTGVVDAMFSTSATSPAMPTSYDRKRRVGSIIRSAGAILAFTQNGDDFSLATPVVDRNSTAAASNLLIALTVPTGVRVSPWLSDALGASASSNVVTFFGDGDSATASVRVNQANNAGNAASVVAHVFKTNTSGQVRYSQDNAAGTTAGHSITTFGWTDTRGRN